MALCVEVVQFGTLGEGLRPIEPQPPTLESCTFVIQSGAEFTSNPLLLTRTEALEIGLAIAGLWVAVGVVKMVSRRI